MSWFREIDDMLVAQFSIWTETVLFVHFWEAFCSRCYCAVRWDCNCSGPYQNCNWSTVTSSILWSIQFVMWLSIPLRQVSIYVYVWICCTQKVIPGKVARAVVVRRARDWASFRINRVSTYPTAQRIWWNQWNCPSTSMQRIWVKLFTVQQSCFAGLHGGSLGWHMNTAVMWTWSLGAYNSPHAHWMLVEFGLFMEMNDRIQSLYS